MARPLLAVFAAATLCGCSKEPPTFVVRNCAYGTVLEVGGELYLDRGAMRRPIKRGTPLDDVCQRPNG